LRIDEAGRLYQTSAWKIGQPDPERPQAVHILLTSTEGTTAVQRETLSQTIADLRQQHSIRTEAIRVIESATPSPRTGDLAIRF
jgi:hypothetical protein